MKMTKAHSSQPYLSTAIANLKSQNSRRITELPLITIKAVIKCNKMINVPMEGIERPFLNGLYTGRIYWVLAVHLPLAANRRQPQYT